MAARKDPATGATVNAPKSLRKRHYKEITPAYVDALKAYSEVLYKGGLAPAGCDNPNHVAARIEIGRDLGIPDTQAINYIMIVNGKASLWGDMVLALIRASGLLASIEEGFEGQPGTDEFTACCTVKRVGEVTSLTVRFSVADAKRANLWGKKGPWQTFPERQLAWRAKGFACRDKFQDVLCGLGFAEEELDCETQPGQVVVVQSEPVKAGETVKVAAIVDAPKMAVNPMTEDQKETLFDLRDCVCAAANAQEEDDKKRVWKKYLIAQFQRESLAGISADEADMIIENIKAQHDFPPF